MLFLMFQLDAYLNEADSLEREAAIFHNSRIPKSLVLGDNEAAAAAAAASSHAATGRGEDEDTEDADDERNEVERENARTFVKRLKDKLEWIMTARGSVEMDHKLQEFASTFCHGGW